MTMDSIKSMNIDKGSITIRKVSNGYVLRYSGYKPSMGGHYDNREWCEKEEVFTKGADAIKRMDELSKEKED